MKRILLLLLAIAPLAGMAQESNQKDTTLYVGNRKIVIRENNNKIKVKLYEKSSEGDTIRNEQILEGVYLDGQSTEQRFTVSVPFVKKNKSGRRGYFDPHVGGIYLGYNRMMDGFSFSNSDDVDLVLSKSFEWGINLFEGALSLTNNNKWALTTGLGFGYSTYRVDNNYAFRKVEGITILEKAEEGINYNKSLLRYYRFRVPVSIEWKSRINHKGPLFFSLGAEAEVRMGVRSQAKYNGKKETIGKELNVNPIGINILAQAGFSQWGIYCRYSTSGLFENNKGPSLYPMSLGIQWFW